jgi:hypothetical protein
LQPSSQLDWRLLPTDRRLGQNGHSNLWRRIQTSRSLSVVRITGFGFGRIASTMAFGSRQEAIDKVRA